MNHSSSSDDEEFRTPKKRRYRSSILHGFSERTAKYHKVSLPPSNGNGDSTSASRNLSTCRKFTNIDANSTDDDLSELDIESEKHQHLDHVSDTCNSTHATPLSDLSAPGYIDSPHSSRSLSNDEDSTSSICSLDMSHTSNDEQEFKSGSSLSISDQSFDSDTTDSDREIRDSDPHTSDSEYGQSFNIHDKELDNPLYEGSEFSEMKTCIMIMLFVTKHSLSKEGFEELLKLISILLPKKNRLPNSSYHLKEKLKTCMNYEEPRIHYFCENCQQLLPDKQHCQNNVCITKSAKKMEFYDLKMEEQLKKLLQDDVFLNAVKKQLGKTKDKTTEISDIVQGQRYKETTPSNNGADLNLTLTLNTDGVAIFQSSKKGSLWPVYIAVNELPVKLRFSRKYLIPSFLHCHSEKPCMMTYLKPLMNTFNSLYDQGITTRIEDQTLLVKAQLLIVSLDLPARALVANMKQFNGKFGCSVCFDEGKSRPEQAMLRYYPYNEVVQLRTHQSMVNDARIAATEMREIHGIKGASPLMMLHYLDVPKSLVIDWMHGVLLGVTKAMMALWFSSKNKEKQYFIGDKVELLDRRLLNIKIPDFIARRQRTIEDHKHWKASEMREWLIHFSVPILQDVLSPEPYFHYTLLVSGISTLVKDNLKIEDIDFAERCLLVFCKVYPKIYGEYTQTMNLHLIRHLPMYVRMYGPLFGYSCFGFESMNSFLKGMVHGTSHINKQISFAVCMTKGLSTLVKSFVDEEEKQSKELFLQLAAKFIMEDKTVLEEVYPLGRKKILSEENELRMLFPVAQRDETIYEYNRVASKGVVFHSKKHQVNKTRSDYVCCFKDKKHLKKGAILSFLQCDDIHYAVVEEYRVIGFQHSNTTKENIDIEALTYFDEDLCHHIERVTGLGTRILIKLINLQKKCVLIEISGNTFISTPPNILEHN